MIASSTEAASVPALRTGVDTDVGFRRALALAAAYGIFVGVAEVVLLTAARVLLNRFTHLNPQLIWMAPLFYVTLFTFIVAVLAAVRTRWRRLRLYRAAVLLTTFVGATGLLLLFTRLHNGASALLALGLGVKLMLSSERARPWLERRAYRLAATLALYPVIAFVGLNGAYRLGEHFGLAPAPAAAGSRHNVVLIIWDTMRAASSSAYGYERETTPHLERLAAAGVTFDRAFSTAPWTLPAHASMFTGRWPAELGADWRVPLGEEPQTIAAVLRDAGYRTGGFVANRFYVGRESGLDRGFLRYDVYPVFSLIEFATSSSLGRAIFNDPDWRLRLRMAQKPGRKYAEQVTDEFLSWLDRSESDRPFFAFLNYFDPHHPYLPPPPYDTMFGPLLPGRDPSMREDRSFSPRELQAEVDAYDGGIAYADSELGRLLRALEERDAADNTIIIVTSDHGEEFGEHDVFTHGNSLYDPALHVPLVVSGPDVPEGVRIAHWVSTRDVASTIAHLTAAPAGGLLGGTSLARLWTAGPGPAQDTLVAAVNHARGLPERYPVSRGDMDAVLALPYKYIRNGDDTEELYDLDRDPGETVDLSRDPAYRQRLEQLRAYWRRIERDSAATAR